MQEKQIRRYQLLLKLRKRKLLNTAIILIVMLAVYWVVQISANNTGQLTYAHAMYVPILYASFVYNKKRSWVFGLLGGLLLGPLLKIDQHMMNWLFRLFVFVAISFLSSLAIDELREDSRLFSVNQTTNIPNQNLLKNPGIYIDYVQPHTIYSVLINNCANLIDLFGIDLYEQVLIKIYGNLTEVYGKKTLIMQPERDVFWIMERTKDPEADFKKLRETLDRQIVLGEINIYLEFTVGIHTVPGREAFNIDNYYRADIAARFAHKSSQFSAHFRDEMINQHQQFDLIGDFLDSLRKGELYLAYQPIIDLKSGEVAHFEALIRWEHPKKGLISPDFFIPLIEETHLINELTAFVIKEAVRQMLHFQEQGLAVKTSVNISVKNLLSEEAVAHIKKAVKEAGISPEHITLEIIETEMLSRSEVTREQLSRLKAEGFKIAIDDFGKGYSSMGYLTDYKIDILKIDNSFSSKLGKDEASGKIVKTLIELAHELGLKVVCEGVEDGEALAIIKDFGADFAQGFYYAQPIHGQEILSWYKKHSEKKFT